MKIGILTVYDSANFGSFLQAFALNEVLKSEGHDVYFINILSGIRRFKDFIKRPKSLNEFIFNYKNYCNFGSDIKRLKVKKLEEINKNSFDLVIIGSDELWNVKNPYFRQKCFYGIGIPTEKKITYAVSVDSVEYGDFQKYPDLINGIKKLDEIFVRDKNTKSIIEKIVKHQCMFTCDPTLLINIDKMKKTYVNPVHEKYLLVYSYGFTEEEKSFIQRYAKEKNLKIISAGLYNSWSDINVSCSPLEFSGIIQGAEYVITTTFHGTIFSILNKKQFISFAKTMKVKDILERIGLSDRAVNSSDGFEIFNEKLNTKIDFNKADENIIKIRKQSLIYLENAIVERRAVCNYE